jgi:hypothetical protein
MKSFYQVVLTECSIVVLFKGVFQTSIPCREWSTNDGSSWSASLRQSHQIAWLIERLTEALNEPTTETTMRRVHRVLADTSIPPRLPPRPRPREEEPMAPRKAASIVPSPMQAHRPSPLRSKAPVLSVQPLKSGLRPIENMSA